jgi:DNA-binding XRE family transcriptional regulator
MNIHTSTQIIRDRQGNPEFAVIPFDVYQRIIGEATEEPYIPHEVVGKIVEGIPIARAWREYFGFTQKEVAEKIGITQAAYSQLENSNTLRPVSRRKIARALDILPEQLVE